MTRITEVVRNSAPGNVFTLGLKHGGVSLGDADLYPTWVSGITAVSFDLYGQTTITDTTNPTAFDYSTEPGKITCSFAGIWDAGVAGFAVLQITSGGIVYQFTDRDNSCLGDLPELYICVRE